MSDANMNPGAMTFTTSSSKTNKVSLEVRLALTGAIRELVIRPDGVARSALSQRTGEIKLLPIRGFFTYFANQSWDRKRPIPVFMLWSPMVGRE